MSSPSSEAAQAVPMGRIERVCLWAAGYAAGNLSHRATDEREPIAKLGGAVLFACLIALANWAIAAFAFTEGFDFRQRIVVAAIGGLFALAAVLTLDRSSLYFFDTAPHRRALVAVWIAVRCLIILAVSSVTAQAIMPMLLKAELTAHALRLREAADARRSVELNSRFDLASKQKLFVAAEELLAHTKKVASAIPEDLQRKLAQVKRCWSSYATRKTALLRAGATEQEARDHLKADAGRCLQQQESAQAEHSAFTSAAQTRLRAAQTAKDAAEQELRSAQTLIGERVEHAAAIEQQAITARSADVLYDLLATHPGAKLKWAILTFVLICLELMPFLSKLLAGRSTIGLRIATDRSIESIAQDRRVGVYHHDAAVQDELGRAMRHAILAACRDQGTQQYCTRLFSQKLAALVPFEIVSALLRDIEAKHVDIETAMRRYPKYAGAIAQAWSQSMREAVDLLTSGSKSESNASRLNLRAA